MARLEYNNAPDPSLPNVSSYFNSASALLNDALQRGRGLALGFNQRAQDEQTANLYREAAAAYNNLDRDSYNNWLRAAASDTDRFGRVASGVWQNLQGDNRTLVNDQLLSDIEARQKAIASAYNTAANVAFNNANQRALRQANTAMLGARDVNGEAIRYDLLKPESVDTLMNSAAKRGLLGAQTAATRAAAGREQAIFDSQQAEAEYKQKWLQITNANTDDITKGRLSLELMTEAANDKRLNPLGRYNLYSWLRTGEDNNAQINEALGPDSRIATDEEAQTILDDINRGGANQDTSKLAGRGINTSSGSSVRRTPTEEEIKQEQQIQEARIANDMINRGVSQGLGAQATWNALNAPIAQEQTPNLTSGSNAFTNIQQTRQERQAQDLADASSGFLPQVPNTNTLGIGGWTNPSTLISQAAQPQQPQNVTSGSARSVQATYSGTDFSNVPKNVDLGNMTPEQQVAVKAVADAVANYDYAKNNLAPGNQAIFAGSVLNETAKVKNQINSEVNQGLSTNGAVNAIEVYNSQNPNYDAAQVKDLLTVTRTDKNGNTVVEERIATRGNLIDGIIRNAALDGSGIFGYTDMDTSSDEYKETIADARRALSKIFNEGQRFGLNDKQIALIASSYTADQGLWFGNDSIQEDNIIRDMRSFSNAFKNGSYEGASIEAYSNFNKFYNVMDSNYQRMLQNQQLMQNIQEYAKRGGILTQDRVDAYNAAKREYEIAENAFRKAAGQSKSVVGKIFDN